MENALRAQTTRARLIDAAIESLADVGYHKTTFVEVCRRSNYSRGAIHHHFDSLPELMSAVVQDIGKRIRNAVVDGLDQLADGSDVYEFGIEFVWRQVNSQAFRALSQLRAVIATDPSLGKNVRLQVKEVQEWWYSQADVIVQTGARYSDPQITRIIFSALTGAALVDWATGSPDNDPDRVIFRQTLVRLISRN